MLSFSVIMLNTSLHNPSVKDIAKFLIEEEGLNKTMIGEYLGEKYVIANF